MSLDAYESSSTYPAATKWIKDGTDPDRFQTPQFDADVCALKNGKSIIHRQTDEEMSAKSFLIIEEPFGRERDSLHHLIDFVVYIDTPLEVAYARKLLRKVIFCPGKTIPVFSLPTCARIYYGISELGEPFTARLAVELRRIAT